MATCAENAAYLAAARAAWHTLSIGGRPVSIGHADKSITYGKHDMDGLNRYIRELQRLVDACNGVTRGGRAIRFMPTDG